jgi:site-specific recombinase XerC
MFAACDVATSAGSRDAAVLAVTYAAGLRRHELVGLDIEDYDQRSGTLRVRGKGRKERVAYVTNGSKSALETWLAVRGDACSKSTLLPRERLQLGARAASLGSSGADDELRGLQ